VCSSHLFLALYRTAFFYMTPFYDTHAHLDSPDFAGDLPATLARALEAGITKIISIGTDLESSRRAIGLAEQYPGLFAAVGWHPSAALEAPDDIRPQLRELARHPKVVALGETGLDYHRLPSTRQMGGETEDQRYKARQGILFRQHLEVAAETALNCVIHQRGDCFEDTLSQMIGFSGKTRGVFHCFAGDRDALARVLALGGLVSFTGIATFKNGQNVRDSIAAAPLGCFMLETDSPFLAPVPHRGRRCEPAFVKELAEVVRQVKGCSIGELSESTCAAANAFFPKLATPA
jgi:TatD DNase family protein